MKKKKTPEPHKLAEARAFLEMALARVTLAKKGKDKYERMQAEASLKKRRADLLRLSSSSPT